MSPAPETVAAAAAGFAPHADADAAAAGDVPQGGDEAEEADEAQDEALRALLQRMRGDRDFPALSAAVRRVQQLTASEFETVQGVAGAILQDVALTSKLLRLVNTAHFHRCGGGAGHDAEGITSLSRAVALVGFAGIRNLALSLVLLEHLHDRGHAAQLVDEFVRVLMAGLLAAELTPLARDAEDAFLAAMLQQLGRLLATCHFPAESQRIRAAMAADAALDAETASGQVLGVGFAALGRAVARQWGLPASLLQRMQCPCGPAPRRAVAAPQLLRWRARAAVECTDALLRGEPGPAVRRLAQAAEVNARALGLEAAVVVDATGAARRRLLEMVHAMGLRVAPASDAARLLAPPASTAASAEAVPRAAPAPVPPATAAAAEDDRAATRLSAGIQAVAQAMAQDDADLPSLLRLVLKTMQQALALQRVVLCVRDAGSGELRGRLAVGADAAALCPKFRIAADAVAAPPAADLFAALCRQGADTLIADAGTGTIAARLPPWFVQHVGAPSFLLLPMMRRGAPIGLIYADAAQPGAIAPGERELALLRTLRDQALMALRQAAAQGLS